MAEDRCLTEEKALNMTPFPPLSTDLPLKLATNASPAWTDTALTYQQ